MSVFCHPTSEFICVSCCSSKTMVASKDTRNYTGSDRSPMSTLRKDRVRVPRLNAAVLTMGYVRRVEEVGEWRGTVRMKSRESIPLEGCPSCPDIESGPGHVQRVRFSRPSGCETEGGETSYLSLQERASCLDVRACPGMAIIMVWCPCRGLG